MPYVITTIDPPVGIEAPSGRITARTAVATLEQARQAVLETVVGDRDHEDIRNVDVHAAHTLDESGGTIDLPDGTMIEMHSVCWNWIIGVAEDKGIDTDAVYESGGDLAILAALNDVL